MKKTAFALMAVFILAAASAVTADQKPRVGPPPLRVESPTLQPSPKHVWVPGYWKWAGINYEWVEGRWVKAKPNKVWVPGTWEENGSYWVWKPGKWTKVKKSDGPENGKETKKAKKAGKKEEKK